MNHSNFRCDLYLIRHGQSESNAEPGLIAGSDFDSNLTAKGEEQAKRLGARLAAEGVEFDRIYSSSYVRAVRTARIMAMAMGTPGARMPPVHALREHEAPCSWRGKRTEEVLTPEYLALSAAKGSDFKEHSGEGLREAERRVSVWLEDELIYNPELVSRPVSMKVAIVGHGTATRCLLRYIVGFDQRMIWRMWLDNCSISRFRFDCQGWSLISINDSVHSAELRSD